MNIRSAHPTKRYLNAYLIIGAVWFRHVENIDVPGPAGMLHKRFHQEDKLTVSRARKVQRFLSQPFHVAEVFTGAPGKYVKVADTVRSFKEIIEGKHDDIPEQAFYMKGTIEEVLEAAKAMKDK